mgnify:CR=1 FL=1|tara:strand:- start:2838 stop:3605 length:768 start_codon:yes stop_codon:yes gene_type:complete
MIKVIFLGTGTSQGIPVIGSNNPVCLSDNPKDKRLRCSVLISWNEKNYLIDCGPDFRQQILKNPINSLDGILFTHSHADHTAGFDDIRPFCFQQGLIDIYSTQEVFNNLKTRFNYIISNKDKYPGAPSVKSNIIKENNKFKLGERWVMPIKAMHNTTPVTGYRFDNVAYMTDVKTLDSNSKSKLENLDVLILNCLRIKPHISHLNLDEAIDIINELKPKKTYLTHISNSLGFHLEINKNLPKNIFLAYDNLSIKC